MAATFQSSLYASRRRRNRISMGLAFAATAFGLSWLVLILAVLLWEGFSGLSLAVFTEMTPPPGSAGGLLNPIVGSLVMTTIAVLIGTPLGILAGTYMAEYGRYDRLTTVVRFINDILLSAPSIVVGLFVYEVMVAQMGHFSGWAGAVSLAVIVVPVVVRTTEDMLILVPDTLREAAASIGLPRSLMITNVAYRAARAGMVTGVLLAVARISGETAPLLFTALNNQFWSLNLNAPVASLPVVIFQFALSPYHGLLLVFDEIQTGFVRSGEMFAYERSGVKPDVMAIAKALGGGFPVGACLATTEASKGMTVGTHGTTFGGNPLAMAVGNAALDIMTDPEFLDRVRKNALLLKQRLAELKDRYASVIAEVRGEGLLIGLRMIPQASEMVDELRTEKLLTVGAGDNVVRLLPPLIIGEEEISEAVARIDRACARLAQAHARTAKVAS